MALTWFPYTISDYDSAREAFSRGGYVYEVIAEALDKQDTELLGVYGAGMGGAGFTKAVPSPDRKSVVSGKSVSVRVDLGGSRFIKKKKQHNNMFLPQAHQ